MYTSPEARYEKGEPIVQGNHTSAVHYATMQICSVVYRGSLNSGGFSSGRRP